MSFRSNSPIQATYLLLGAGFETPNLGVAALASGALTGILRADPNAQVVIGDYSKYERKYSVRLADGECQVPLLPFRFSWRIWLPNNIFRLLVVATILRFLPFGLGKAWMRGNRWLQTIDAAQAVFAVNGGDSFSDIYGLRRLIYVLLPQFLALQLGKPLVLLPQTYGPFCASLARRLAGGILNRAHIISTREHDGERAVEVVTAGRRNAEFAHDMAFLMPSVTPAPHDVAAIEALKGSSGGIVGFNISGLLWMGGYSRDNSFGMRSDYRSSVEQLIAHFIERLDCRILLVPHVGGEDGEGDVRAIREFLANVPEHLRERVTFIDARWDQHQVKWVIAQCEFFVGSRMHACIAALSQTVPAVGLAYSGKFRGVFRTISAEDLVADLRTMDVASVVEFVGAAYRKRHVLKESLARQVPLARATVSALFSRVIASKDERPVDSAPSRSSGASGRNRLEPLASAGHGERRESDGGRAAGCDGPDSLLGE